MVINQHRVLFVFTMTAEPCHLLHFLMTRNPVIEIQYHGPRKKLRFKQLKPW